MPLAVPILCLLANAPSSDRKDLLSELELMKKMKPHPHVIKLMGCITEDGKNHILLQMIYLFLVYIKIENG